MDLYVPLSEGEAVVRGWLRAAFAFDVLTYERPQLHQLRFG